MMEKKERKVVEMEAQNLDMVEAEFMDIRQSTIRAVEGGHIELQQVGALSVDGERVEVTQGASVLTRGETVTLNQSATVLSAGTTSNLNFSFASFSISAGATNVSKSAVGAMIGREITANDSTSILMIGKKVNGQVTTLLDWRSALALGSVAGGILGLFMLFKRR